MNTRSRTLATALALTTCLLGLIAGPALASGTLPTGTHDGAIPALAKNGLCYANGWAFDPDDPSGDVTVRISADGTVVATVEAGDFRQDLLDGGFGDGTAAFWVPLAGLISPGVAHVIRVDALDDETSTWTALDSTPRVLTCTGLDGFHDTAGGTFGRSSCRVEGWAFDADAPTGPRVEVRASVDGHVVADTTADLLREDVRDAGFGDGYSGFSIDLFGRMTPNVDHVVTIEARDTDAKRIWLPLEDTDKVMACTAR
jgi:hypothetical protein